MTPFDHVPFHKEDATHSNEYQGNPTEIWLRRRNNYSGYSGKAYRTGITRPGYPPRAVYSIRITGREQGYFVFDNGEFYRSAQWHDAQSRSELLSNIYPGFQHYLEDKQP